METLSTSPTVHGGQFRAPTGNRYQLTSRVSEQPRHDDQTPANGVHRGHLPQGIERGGVTPGFGWRGGYGSHTHRPLLVLAGDVSAVDTRIRPTAYEIANLKSLDRKNKDVL